MVQTYQKRSREAAAFGPPVLAYKVEIYFINLENLKLTQVLSTQFIYNQFITIFTPLIKEQHRNKTID